MTATTERQTTYKILVSQIWPSHPEVDWARQFAESLRRRGLEVFQEWSIENNPSEDEVREQLKSSDLVVVLLDERGVNTPTFFFEYGAAIAANKPLVAVVPPNIPPSQLPELLRRGRYLVRQTPEGTADAVVRWLRAGLRATNDGGLVF